MIHLQSPPVLAACRACESARVHVHSISPNLPIHLSPLPRGEKHEVDDAAIFICKDCGLVQLQEASDEYIVNLYSKGGCLEDDLPLAETRLARIKNSLGQQLFQEARTLDIRAEHLSSMHLPDAQLDIITAFHVFQNLPKPRILAARLAKALRPGGMLLVEVPGLVDSVKNLPHSVVLHQRQSIFSLHCLHRVFASAGLLQLKVIRDADVILVAYQKPDPARPSIEIRSDYIQNLRYINILRSGLDSFHEDLQKKLAEISPGAKSGFYGASGSHALFLANFPYLLQRVQFGVDRDPRKHGKLVPGTKIPIIAPQQITAEKPEHLFFLSTGLCEQMASEHRDIRCWDLYTPLTSAMQAAQKAID
jgi:SAM-dependent methyltransferase